MGRKSGRGHGSTWAWAVAELAAWTNVFRCTGSVFPQCTMVALPSAVAAGVLQWAFPDASMSMFGEDGGILTETITWSGFTFLLGFLVVFRTSQSYTRWWEGCSSAHCMRAEWFDAALTLCTFADHSGEPRAKIKYFKRVLVRLTSLLQATALAELEKGEDGEGGDDVGYDRLFHDYELIAPDDLDQESWNHFRMSNTKVELVYGWILHHIMDGVDHDVLPTPAPLLTRAFQELGNGLVHYHNALKLVLSPFPFAYAQTCDGLLLIHWIIAPVVTSQWTTHAVWAALFAFIQVFVLALLNCIAGELANPFGADRNDVNGAVMQMDMNVLLRMLLEPGAERAPRMHGGWEDLGSLAAADNEGYRRSLSAVIAKDRDEAMVLAPSTQSDDRFTHRGRSLSMSLDSVRRILRAVRPSPSSTSSASRAGRSGGAADGAAGAASTTQDLAEDGGTGGGDEGPAGSERDRSPGERRPPVMPCGLLMTRSRSDVGEKVATPHGLLSASSRSEFGEI